MNPTQRQNEVVLIFTSLTTTLKAILLFYVITGEILWIP